MKLFLTLFVSAVLFASCGKKDDTKTTDTQNKDSNQQVNKETSTKTDTIKNGDVSTNKPSGDGIKNLTYEPGKLPASVKYAGKIVGGAKWEDKNGQNVLIVTETEEKTKGDARSKELFAYQYIMTGESAKQLWKVNDFIKDCQVDLMLSLIPGSISVTDINNNGIAENTFLYRMSCKGDVSPDDMKLIMHEGDNKYAIRGQMLMELDGKKYGGEMEIDPSFDFASPEVNKYAVSEWKKYITEKPGK